MELVVKKYDELTLDELYGIIKARINIFVVEQNCPYPELDDKDQPSYHVFFRDENGIQAYLRVVDKGVGFDEYSLGRVITVARGCGLGAKLIEAGVQVAKEKFGAKRLVVAAQVQASGFYAKQGFRQCSDEFMEDGIPHIMMEMDVE